MSEFILNNGMSLYYEDIGSGQPVLLIHGWTSSHEVFTEPVKLLAGKGRFISYDQRGHGGSKGANGEKATVDTLADDLDELIEGLILKDITLLGWSMGASTVLNYIGKFGCSRLKQVILCDMTPKKVNDDGWKLGLYQGKYTESDRMVDSAKDCKTMVGEYALHADPKLMHVPQQMLEIGLNNVLDQCDADIVMNLFNSMNEHDDRSCVDMITVPLTYFYSEPGTLYSPKLAKWYESRVKIPYKSVAFPDSTHLFISEFPKEFATELEKLL